MVYYTYTLKDGLYLVKSVDHLRFPHETKNM